jgi:hypothetical protein
VPDAPLDPGSRAARADARRFGANVAVFSARERDRALPATRRRDRDRAHRCQAAPATSSTGTWPASAPGTATDCAPTGPTIRPGIASTPPSC